MNEERKKVRDEKRSAFNPNESGLHDDGIFGLPFTPEESELVIIPVPWEATVSYNKGTARGPEAILNASKQLDLYDPLHPSAWERGIAMLPIPDDVVQKGIAVRELTEKYLDSYMAGSVNEELKLAINDECKALRENIKEQTLSIIDNGQIAGLVGGEHSVSLGYFEALAERYENFGILQIDAHADLRDAYEGLEYSHASIFFNALKIKNMERLVQVGIRDLSESENEIQWQNQDKIKVFSSFEIRRKLFEGKTFEKVCDEIVDELPQNVCISFDIDGLLPYLSPATGTPVAGGLGFEEVVYLFEKVLASGRKIIGFDLVEVAPSANGSEWDGNVGARVLYKLCLLALESGSVEENETM